MGKLVPDYFEAVPIRTKVEMLSWVFYSSKEVDDHPPHWGLNSPHP
jgi:hypothetical protein